MTISLAAEPIFHIGSLPVTNSILVMWVVIAVIFLFSFFSTRKITDVPRGIQNVGETIIESLLLFIDGVTNNREQSKKFFPLIATFFITIITANWLGLLPGVGTIGLYEAHEGSQVLIPFFRSPSADLNFTLALALISVISIQIVGITSIGFFKHAGKFITFKSPIAFFVGILELILEVAKVISFAFRLFGNVFAGEVLLTVIMFLAPYFLPLPFLGMELFVGFIQALVFSMLTLVFYKMATEEAH